METFSQAAQDLFPQVLLKNHSHVKTYLDIGCHHPTIFNNSYALERAGWKGLSMDIQDFHKEFDLLRSNPFRRDDVTRIDWGHIIDSHFESRSIDYISFDVDDATHAAFSRFPFSSVRFKTMTLEHDGYRVGTQLRDSIRSQLSSYGYTLICSDVIADGYGAFEDWWVDIREVDAVSANKLKCDNVSSKIIKNTLMYISNEN